MLELWRPITGSGLALLMTVAAPAFAEDVDFALEVRPLLAARCFPCHGPDEKHREADLRLDLRESATAHRGEYRVIDPDRPEGSELLYRVRAGGIERMPPESSGPPLTDREVALLERWISEGAEYSPHWSFRPIAPPPLPDVNDKAWPRSPLDHFALARLESSGLTPAEEADRATLLRRVTLDLTGLPPTAAERDRFLSDTSPRAYEKLVDRLLDSPAFGERWAAVWLDLARYADTKGYEKDLGRSIWRYRDWVIEAFNRDLPYDRFLIEQVAGDLLDSPDLDQRIATAFHRNTMTNDEGGTDDEEFRIAAVKDRVDTTGQVLMGLTVGCAKCHSHKYDPITQRAYYELFAFFDQTEDADRFDEAPVISAPTKEQQDTITSLERQIAELDASLERRGEAAQAAVAAWSSEWWREQSRAEGHLAPTKATDWEVTGPYVAEAGASAFRSVFPPEPGYVGTEAVLWTRQPEWPDATAHILDPAPNAAVYLRRRLIVPSDRQLELQLGSDDGLEVWVDGRSVLQRDVARGVAPNQDRVSVDLSAGEHELILAVINRGGDAAFWFAIGDELRGGVPIALARSFALDWDQRTEADRGLTTDLWLARVDPIGRRLNADREALTARLETVRASVPTVPVFRELPPDRHRTTRIHRRGNFLDPGEEVSPKALENLLPWSPEWPKNRLGLARWITDPSNPLTARVLVNRTWARLFGSGIVETEEDFGAQGALPSHPKLLDHLAADVVRSGWSFKSLCRTLVLSSTYRQSSAVTPEKLERDPRNRLLSRGPRVRLPGEMVRDAALSVSGLLNPERFGPSVMPYQPPGVWQAVYNTAEWQTSPGDERHRRALYTYWRRTSPYPALEMFDLPSREICTPRRIRTNTPLQALVTLNDPAFVECAQALARQSVRRATPVRWMFEQALLREPEPGELGSLSGLLQARRAHFANDREAALARTGEPLDEGSDLAEVAALTAVAQVILNLDEFLTKR
ncbi:MAG: PSD1 and planctomycete cytochrome C domain-containing protein [Planctomycetota bacterium]